MEDTLKRLLDAETAAEGTVNKAKAERESIIRTALEEARLAEDRFAKRASEIHAFFLGKANEKAEQSIGELQRRYDERNKELRQTAEEHEAEAVEAAYRLLLDPGKG